MKFGCDQFFAHQAFKSIVGLFVFICLVLAGGGCRELKKGERWLCKRLVYSNNIVEVYWEGQEFILERLGENSELTVTARRYLLSRIDVHNYVCTESFVSEEQFASIEERMKRCLDRIVLPDLESGLKIIDADCSSGNLLLLPPMSTRFMTVSPLSTNIHEAFLPFTLGKGAINERGEVVFISSASSPIRHPLDEAEFAVFRSNRWWRSKITGRMPEMTDVSFNRTSVVPVLSESP
jgi:hypothetical protein